MAPGLARSAIVRGSLSTPWKAAAKIGSRPKWPRGRAPRLFVCLHLAWIRGTSWLYRLGRLLVREYLCRAPLHYAGAPSPRRRGMSWNLSVTMRACNSSEGCLTIPANCSGYGVRRTGCMPGGVAPVHLLVSQPGKNMRRGSGCPVLASRRLFEPPAQSAGRSEIPETTENVRGIEA